MGLDQCRKAGDQKPNNDERKKGWPIGGVMMLEVEAADRTGIDNTERVLKELALATLRTARAANLLGEGTRH